MSLSHYLLHLQSQLLSPSTVRQRHGFAVRWAEHWGTLDVPAHKIAEWLMSYTGWTRLTYFGNLTSLYDWATEVGLVEENPVERFRRPRSPGPRPQPLAEPDLRRVLDTATGDLHAWLQLGNLQGLRCHEIAKIHGRDIDERGLFVHGKGGDESTLPTHPAVWSIAQQYPRDGYWFPSRYHHRDYVSVAQIGNTVRAHLRANGIPVGSIHRLRHTYGTRLARNGVHVKKIQKLMRHSSLETTQRYLDATDDELAEAIRTLAA